MQELAVLASRVLTAKRQFESVADNVANVNTQGYRKLDMEFKEIVSRPARSSGANYGASYVEDRAIHVSPAQGALVGTSNPLDVAISGSGFFQIDVDGSRQFTRRGQFVLNNESTLVTPEGYPVLDNTGAQIQIPVGAKNVQISPDGSISTEQGLIVPIGVYEFSPEDLKKLQRAGNTAFVPTNGAGARLVGVSIVRQGYLEGSNVNAIQEMVNMQAVTRTYENSVKLMKGLEDLESRAIQQLGSQ